LTKAKKLLEYPYNLPNGNIFKGSRYMIIKKPEDIGSIIKTERKRQNMTQTQLAAACGVGVRFIVDAEKGKQTASLGKILKVINMLGVELRYDRNK